MATESIREVIDKVGADALRFMLITGITPGDTNLSGIDLVSRICKNKLWNASEFTIMNLLDDEGNPLQVTENAMLRDEDKWIISRT